MLAKSVNHCFKSVCALLLLGAILLLAGCPHLQLVAGYDAKTFEETIRVGREVDLFYGQLIELSPHERRYAQFAERYVEIEADLRALVRRNAARALNSQSREISESILGFWNRYRDKHKAADRYDDAVFDRDRFTRLFNAAAAAEEAKRLEDGDRTD